MMTALKPTLISNRYRLMHEIGAGGMGVVYQADDRLISQPVALKLVTAVRPEPLPGDTLTGSESAAMIPPPEADRQHLLTVQLTHEFQTLATLRHPHIISVLDYGFDVSEHAEPRIYYTMELLVGAQTILQAAHLSSLDHKIDLLIQLLSALEYLHRRRILHRDLKPENVLVTAQGSVKVMDFGLAALRDQPEPTGPISGTLAYMPPEILQGQPPSEASDLYAVGVIAYQLLTGTHPFDTSDLNRLLQSILKGKFDVERLYGAEQQALFDSHTISPDGAPSAPTLTQIITRLLEKYPQDRYAHAGDVIRALNHASGRSAPHEDPAIRESFLQAGRFVGRDAEWKRLKSAADRVVDGQGSAFLIGGESGIGKSRLIDELRIYALTKGAYVLRGQGIEGGGRPFELWRDPLRRLALSAPLTDFEAAILKEIVPDIEILLERVIPAAPELDANAAYQRLLRTIAAIFRAQKRPLVLLLEDLQWVRESLDVLRAVLPLVQEVPLLIVGTFRDDEAPHLPAQFPNTELIKLGRLSHDSIAALCISIFGEMGERPDLLALIEAESDGNVFFIVEVVRSLAERAGSLEQAGSQALPLNDPVGGLSGGIEQILNRRIERVAEPDRVLLGYAAVAGRVLDLAVIAHLAAQIAAPSAPLSIDAWLLRCADAAVLEVFENNWRFRHDKLRGVLITQVKSSGSFPRLNHQVAEAIEQAYSDPADRALRAAALAQHWSAAGVPDKEAQYQVLAGEQMMSSADYAAAIPAFERALTLYEQANANATIRARVMRLICEAHYNMGNMAANLALSYRTLALLKFYPRADQPIVHHSGSVAVQMLRQFRYVLLPSHRSRPIPERYHIAMQITEPLTMVHYFQNNRIETIYHMLLGLNLADAGGRTAAIEQARFSGVAAFLFAILGWRRIAQFYDTRAINLIQTLTDPNAKIWILQFTAFYHILVTQWDTAHERLIHCMNIARKIEHARRVEEAYVSLIAVQYYSGNWQEARTLTDEMYIAAVMQGSPQTQGWALDNYGRFALREGDFVEARRLFSESMRLYEQADDIIGMVWLKGAIAKTYLYEGDLDAAQPYIEAIAPVLQETISTSFGMLEAYSAVTEYMIARWAREPGRKDRRDDSLSAVEHMRRYAHVVMIAAPQYALFSGRCAALNGHADAAKRWYARAIAEAERRHMPYDEGLAHVQISRTLAPTDPQRRQHLDRAIRLFRELGALWDLRGAEQDLMH